MYFFFGLNNSFNTIIKLKGEISNYDLNIRFVKYNLILIFFKLFFNRFTSSSDIFQLFKLYPFYLEFFSVDFFCNVFVNKHLFNNSKISNDFFLIKTNSQLVFSKNFKIILNFFLDSKFSKNILLLCFCFKLVFFKQFLFFLFYLKQQIFVFNILIR